MEKRLFIAIKYMPDEPFLQSFQTIQTRVNSWAAVKWVPSHQLHLTLCFLGNTHISLVKPIETVINEVCNQHHVFDARIAQLNTFSHQRQPRVLWMGLEPVEKFQQLHKQLSRQLMQIFKCEKTSTPVPHVEVNSNFKPHLTLGRFKTTFDPNNLATYLASQTNALYGSWLVRQIVLYESILSPAGPTYHQLVLANLQSF